MHVYLKISCRNIAILIKEFKNFREKKDLRS